MSGLKTIKATKGQRITLSPSADILANDKAFKQYEVLSNNVTIDENSSFIVGVEDVSIRGVYVDVGKVQGNYTFTESTLKANANFYKNITLSNSNIQNDKQHVLEGRAEYTLPLRNVEGIVLYNNTEQLKGQVEFKHRIVQVENAQWDMGDIESVCLIGNSNDRIIFCTSTLNIIPTSTSNVQHFNPSQIPTISSNLILKDKFIGNVECYRDVQINGNSTIDLNSSINGRVDTYQQLDVKGVFNSYVISNDGISNEITSQTQIHHFKDIKVEGNIIVGDNNLQGRVQNDNTNLVSSNITFSNIISNAEAIYKRGVYEVGSNATLEQMTSEGKASFSKRVLVEGDIVFDNILSNTKITYTPPNTNMGEGANNPNHPNYGTPEYCNLNLFHPSNKCEFKDYCLRRLGKPVIQINVSDSQIEDLIAEGVDYFQLYHYDGSETLYYPITITKEIIQSQSIPIDSSKFIGVNRLLESSFYGQSQFTVEWQLMASTYPYALKGDGLLTYYQAMQYQSLLRLMVSGKTKDIRFSRHTNRLHLNCDWSSLKEGQVFVAEVVQRIDPNDNPALWNDPFLKEYVTSLIKLQWGNNLRKLKGVQMIGGVQIDADGILNEAIQELQNLKENMIWKHQEPLDFWMG